MKNPIRMFFTDENDRFFLIRCLLLEVVLILVLAFIFWLLKNGSFIKCFYMSACLMSMASICHLGVEVFSSLDDNRWRIKLAKQDYPIFKAVILIILNAIVFLLTAPLEKAYYYFIVPVLLWGMLLFFNRIHRIFNF